MLPKRTRLLMKKFLRDWIFTPKLRQAFHDFSHGKRGMKQYWFHEPIDVGLHNLPIFKNNNQRAWWLSLNYECRPSILVKNKTRLKINVEGKPLKSIQLGFGVKECDDISQVEVYINGVMQGSVKNLFKESWCDLRIPLDSANEEIDLEIKCSGRGRLFLSYPYLCTAENVKPNAQTIVCIVLDGLSQKFFAAIEKTAPRYIQNYFRDGVQYTQAFSQSDWTLPSFSSILTGLYPHRHGVNNSRQYATSIPDNISTLPEILRENGYRTFGYSSHRRFNPAYGHAKGFDRFIYRLRSKDDYYIQIINEAILHLEAHAGEKNFVFIHFFDTHAPYTPSSYIKNLMMRENRVYDSSEIFSLTSSKESYDNMVDEARAKLFEVDLALNALFSYLEDHPQLKDSAVILTCDHGVHPKVKGKMLLSELRLHVPLMIKGCGIKAGTNASFVESVDIMPTILEIAGLKPINDIDGRNLPCLGGSPRESVFSESLFGNAYNAVIRDENFATYLSAPYDERTGRVDLTQVEPIKIFRRKNLFDQVGDEMKANEKQLETAMNKFLSCFNGK